MHQPAAWSCGPREPGPSCVWGQAFCSSKVSRALGWRPPLFVSHMTVPAPNLELSVSTQLQVSALLPCLAVKAT